MSWIIAIYLDTARSNLYKIFLAVSHVTQQLEQYLRMQHNYQKDLTESWLIFYDQLNSTKHKTQILFWKHTLARALQGDNYV